MRLSAYHMHVLYTFCNHLVLTGVLNRDERVVKFKIVKFSVLKITLFVHFFFSKHILFKTKNPGTKHNIQLDERKKYNLAQ